MIDYTPVLIGGIGLIVTQIGFLITNISLYRKLKTSELILDSVTSNSKKQFDLLNREIDSQRKTIESYKEKEKRLREIITEIKQQNGREVIAYEKLLSLMDAQQKSIDAISKVIEQLKVNQ